MAWETPKDSRGHYPNGRWEFDGDVASCIGDMMQRSVPGYARMRRLVADLADLYIVPGSSVVELGAANGDGIAEMAFGHREAQFYAVEHSPPMLAILHDRFAGSKNVEVVDRDLANLPPHARPRDHASLFLAVLVLQFLPVAGRRALVAEVFSALRKKGALLLVEKTRSDAPALAVDLELRHLAQKHANGYSWAEIEAKHAALADVLVPLSIEANLRMLREAGFQADVFWADTNFAGFVAEKP